VVHVAVHTAVLMRLGGRAVRAIVVVAGRIRHRTGLQRQIQPHSHKQAQGAAAPGLLPLSDAGELAQVLVSNTILQYR